MREVDRSSKIKFGILVYPWLLVYCLQCPHATDTLIEIDLCLTIGQTHNNLVDSCAPADAIDRGRAYSQSLDSLESRRVIKMHVAFLFFNIPS